MDRQYLNLMARILREGEKRVDRTGVGTVSVFSHTLECDLADGFPLLTTKKVHFKAIKEELLWFLSGSTDSQVLRQKRSSVQYCELRFIGAFGGAVL